MKDLMEIIFETMKNAHTIKISLENGNLDIIANCVDQTKRVTIDKEIVNLMFGVEE